MTVCRISKKVIIKLKIDINEGQLVLVTMDDSTTHQGNEGRRGGYTEFTAIHIKLEMRISFMEDIIDYEAFKNGLVMHYSRIIEEIGKNEEYRDIYVLILQTDVTNQYVSLFWNTESSLNERYEEQVEIYGEDCLSRDEMKFEDAYFVYEEYYDWPDDLDVYTKTIEDYFSAISDEDNDFFDQAYDRFSTRYISCMIDVLNELKPAIIKLKNITNDFICYVTDHDDTEVFQYAKETVPEDVFRRVCVPYLS